MDSELKRKLDEMQKKLPNLSGSEKDSCFFCDCESNSIKSHSLSKKKVLSLLEDKIEKGGIGIYYLEDMPEVDFKEDKSISSYTKVHRRLFNKGKDTISTFYGFCSNCDKSVFTPLDRNDYQNKAEVNFLHALRTQAYQLTLERNFFLHIKNNIVSLLGEADKGMDHLESVFPKFIQDGIDKIPDYENVEWESAQEITGLLGKSASLPIKSVRQEMEVQQKKILENLINPANYPMTGIKYKTEIKKVLNFFNYSIGLYKKSPTYNLENDMNTQIERIENEIRNLTELYRTKSFEVFSYQCISIEGAFLVAGAFTYILSNQSKITLTFFPEESTNKTYFVFSERKAPGSNSLYLSTLNFKSEQEFRMDASNIILSAGANVFISPKYYEKLPIEVKKLLIQDKTGLKKIGFNLFSDDYLN